MIPLTRRSADPRVRLLLCAGLLLGVFATLSQAAAAPREMRFPATIRSVTRLSALDALLQRSQGWTGGDGTHSLALTPARSLWLFGDTFYGEVARGRRVRPVMVHNSAAWYENGAFTFFPTRGDLLRPQGDSSDWYWPGDGAIVDGRLALFCMRVRHAEKGAFGFDFDWYTSDLLEIDNPRDEPTRWRIIRQQPAPSLAGVRLGAACAVARPWLYAWGVRPDDPSRALYLARRRIRGGPWAWWCDGGWQETGAPRPLFTGAAPEMSVTPLHGGWLAVYSPNGFSAQVAMRWAAHPEGPWSDEAQIWKAPEGDEKLFVYGARAHPELGGPGLVLSYNCNAPTPERLMGEASAYAPRFVRVLFGF